MSLHFNDIIRLPDGREGTICYHFLDGDGGVWGKHKFSMPDSGFGEELPLPEFMLRAKVIEGLLRQADHRRDVECVGESYELVQEASHDPA